MHVLLADDHELVRSGLKFYLERLASKVTVIEAATFEEALVNSSQAPQLDLIILDLKMPGMNGFAGLEMMRARFPKVPAVILSGSVRRGDVLAALAAGAAGYIPKTLSGKAMFNALQLILAGETYVPSIVLPDSDSMPGQPDADKGAPAAGDNPLSKLTPRERDALALLNSRLSQQGDRKASGNQGNHREGPSERRVSKAPRDQPDPGRQDRHATRLGGLRSVWRGPP